MFLTLRLRARNSFHVCGARMQEEQSPMHTQAFQILINYREKKTNLLAC